MFTSYKKHKNKLYNSLVKLSRNNFFYQDMNLDDKLETRVYLIFFHFAFILRATKLQKREKETQEVFDNIFQNIEYNLRELGDGDVSVNKKMKKLTRVFYDILLNLDKKDSNQNNNIIYLIEKYFMIDKKKDTVNIKEFCDYFSKFQNFCFDLDVKNMLNGSFNFVYK